MPQRTTTTHLSLFHRPGPNAVTYDLCRTDEATITLPAGSSWTSELHWHETHDEYLQVLQGRILVTLGKLTKEHVPEDGPIEIRKGVVHEWRRVLGDSCQDDVVVREWTVPSDGQKELFFRVLISYVMERQPEKLHRRLPFPEKLVTGIEKWVVDLQVFMIFMTCDNYPVIFGSGHGWMSWAFTHTTLLLASWFGLLLGLNGMYPEYVGADLRRRVVKNRH